MNPNFTLSKRLMEKLKRFREEGDEGMLSDMDCAEMEMEHFIDFLNKWAPPNFVVHDPVNVAFSDKLRFISACLMGDEKPLVDDHRIHIVPVEWEIRAGTKGHFHVVNFYYKDGEQFLFDSNGGMRSPKALLDVLQRLFKLPPTPVEKVGSACKGPQYIESQPGAYKRGTPTGYCFSWAAAGMHYMLSSGELKTPMEITTELNNYASREFIMKYTAAIMKILKRKGQCPASTRYKTCTREL